jgi:hypothetical protein
MRMGDTRGVWPRNTPMSSRAARELAARRWGAARPVRLARELVLRAAELPEVERRQLLDALSEVRVTRRPL